MTLYGLWFGGSCYRDPDDCDLEAFASLRQAAMPSSLATGTAPDSFPASPTCGASLLRCSRRV